MKTINLTDEEMELLIGTVEYAKTSQVIIGLYDPNIDSILTKLNYDKKEK